MSEPNSIKQMMSLVAHEAAALVAKHGAPIAPEWLSPKQVAVYAGLPVKTLEQLRRTGTGPRFCKAGVHLIRYRRSDIDAWIEKGAAK